MKIAVAIEKGGTAKTTTAVNLAFEMVILLDAANYLGPDAPRIPDYQPIIHVLDLDAQQDAMAFAEQTAAYYHSEAATPRRLPALAEAQADYIFMDCPPALGPEVAAALKIADYVLVPVNSQSAAVRGLQRLLETIEAARNGGNPTLRTKLVLTMFDSRANHCHDVEMSLREAFGKDVLKTRIPHTYIAADAALEGKPLGMYAPESTAGLAYRELAKEIIALTEPNKERPAVHNRARQQASGSNTPSIRNTPSPKPAAKGRVSKKNPQPAQAGLVSEDSGRKARILTPGTLISKTGAAGA